MLLLKSVVDAQHDLSAKPPSKDRSYQAFWFWLVLLERRWFTSDVAVRRIAVEPSEAAATMSNWWSRLRDAALHNELPRHSSTRLRSRKQSRSRTRIDKDKSTRRFEGEGTVAAGELPPASGSSDRTTRADVSAPAQPVTPAESPEDFAARLMKAKRKAMEDRDKKND